MKKKLIYATALALMICSCSPNNAPSDYTKVNALPEVFPLYNDVTVPYNIAPLNFQLSDGDEYNVYTEITGANGTKIQASGAGGVEIDEEKWHALLAENKGKKVSFAIYVETPKGWMRYKDYDVSVSPYEIDYGVTFREITPSYSKYGQMQTTQHCLGNSEEEELYSGYKRTRFASCVNCHTFNKTNSSEMTYHVRSDFGIGGTIIMKNNQPKLFNMKGGPKNSNFVYPYWHPKGRYIAYSQNGTTEIFPFSMNHRIEVFDLYGFIAVYDTKENKAIRSPLLNDTTYMCNMPAFSPDGKKLYFGMSCAAPASALLNDVKKIQYNLCCIDFDEKTGKFGDKIDTIINAQAMGKSIAYPRPSYDGRYILYTLADYGYFHIHHKEADLWIYDLKDKTSYPLTAVNSDECESFHSWSSNSHWIVFSTRRDDAFNARLYFASVDDKGRWTKPFLMPQKRPLTHYMESVYSQTVPDFINKKVMLDTRKVGRLLDNKEEIKIRQ